MERGAQTVSIFIRMIEEFDNDMVHGTGCEFYEIVEMVAELWVENGGDVESFRESQDDIIEAIKDLTNVG